MCIDDLEWRQVKLLVAAQERFEKEQNQRFLILLRGAQADAKTFSSILKELT